MINTSTLIYLNGNLQKNTEKAILPNDRGFLLGDGLFETLRSYSGVPILLEYHWLRLKKSAEQLNIPFLMSVNELKQVIHDLLGANYLLDKDAGIRITLSRGAGDRGLIPPLLVNPTLMITTFNVPALPLAPIKLILAATRRNEYSPLSRLKSLNYLDNILAMQAAVAAGADDALLLNTQSFVAETTIANIFIVKNNQLFTPRIEDGALPGVMRDLIIRLCAAEGIFCQERTLDLTTLLDSDEVFMTNAIREICPVSQIDQCFFPKQNNLMTEYLMALIKISLIRR